jgi:hypothetical protein
LSLPAHNWPAAEPAFDPHPVCALFPRMSDTELADLAEDIRRHGLQAPIVVLDGQILDGRNRLLACQVAGIEPRFVAWAGNGDPADFVVSANLHRRHLTESQRAMVAVSLTEFWNEARDRQLASRLKPGEHPIPGERRVENGGKAAAAAAEVVEVSTRLVESAIRVHKHGVPELADAVRSGAVDVTTAARFTRADADTQRQLARDPASVKPNNRRGRNPSRDQSARSLATDLNRFTSAKVHAVGDRVVLTLDAARDLLILLESTEPTEMP